MPVRRKLGRPTDQRVAILRGLVTSLIAYDGVWYRDATIIAKVLEETNNLEQITTWINNINKIYDEQNGVKEADNFTSKQVKVSSAKLDSVDRKITKSVTSKSGKKYEVVEREEKTDMVRVDNPSRLHARRQIMKWVYRTKDADGNRINVVDKLFDDIAPKYKDRKGGYTRIYKIGPRRGDAAPMAILELVD